MTFHACFGYLALGGLGSCYSFDREREVDHRHEKIFSTTARSQAERDPKFVRSITPLCDHVFAGVNVLDVREDERVVVLACNWVGDVYRFVELVFHAKSVFP